MLFAFKKYNQITIVPTFSSEKYKKNRGVKSWQGDSQPSRVVSYLSLAIANIVTSIQKY